MLTKYLKAALVFVLASVATAQNSSIIFMDYTSGFSTVLPLPNVNAIADTRVYNTNGPGVFRFGVDWNNDAQDSYNIVSPVFATVVAEAPNAQFCTPNGTNTEITFTQTSPHQCNYTVFWNVSFSGLMTVTYNGGPNTGSQRSDAITIFFSNTSTVGDPQFVGLRGQSYQVHGVDGAVYNIISEKSMQVNSRFVFLTEGQCPMIDGFADSNCWSHPGSYMGEMSFQAVVDGKLHAALITAGSAKKGFAMVQMDGNALKVGDKVSFGSFSLQLTSTHRVFVQTENFDFELTNSDLFINQALRSKVALAKLQSHGLLGQTHSTKTHSSPLRYIEGEVDDYVIADNDIFGDDFVYNQFKA
jgi:hypothetical protein